MVLGSYYLTSEGKGEKGEGKIFMDYDEMMKAYLNKDISLHANVKVRVKLSDDDRGKLVESTVGRFIFNRKIPQDLGYVDRKKDPYTLEIDSVVDKKALGVIVDKCFRRHGNIRTAKLLDDIKSMGFKYSTIGALTISMGDINVPDEKFEILKEADKQVEKYEKLLKRGLVSEVERYEFVIKVADRKSVV